MKDGIKNLRLTNFLILTIAGFVNAFGVTVFLAPVRLYDSGISGTSMLLSQITPEYLTLSVFLILLNVPLFFVWVQEAGIDIYRLFFVYCFGVLSGGMADNRCFAH